MSLFLHGVVRAGHRLPEGSPFRLVGLDEHAVVVSDRRDDHGLTEQEATAHLAGLCALLPGGPVLPLRIGTTAVDEVADPGRHDADDSRSNIAEIDLATDSGARVAAKPAPCKFSIDHRDGAHHVIVRRKRPPKDRNP